MEFDPQNLDNTERKRLFEEINNHFRLDVDSVSISFGEARELLERELTGRLHQELEEKTTHWQANTTDKLDRDVRFHSLMTTVDKASIQLGTEHAADLLTAYQNWMDGDLAFAEDPQAIDPAIEAEEIEDIRAEAIHSAATCFFKAQLLRQLVTQTP